MPRKEPVQEVVEEIEKKPEDLSVHVLDAMIKRGLKVGKFDTVKTIHLWDENYRVNCFKGGRIPESYFVRFTKEEGILCTEPNLEG